MKRSGGNRQLRPHEIEALESRDSEGPGVFEMADTQTIKQRRIVRSKRKKRRSAISLSSSTSSSSSSNGGGLTFMDSTLSTQKNEEGTKPKNVFAGFTGLTDGAGDDVPALTFPSVDLSKPVGAITPPDFSIGAFGGGGAVFGGEENEATSGSNPVFLPLSAPKGATEAPSKNGIEAAESNDSNAGKDSTSFIQRRRRLNKSFHKWVCKQMERNEYSDWTIGVQDYINHMRKLKSQKSKVSSSYSAKPKAASPSLASSSSTTTSTGPVVEVGESSDVKTDDSSSSETKVHGVRAKYFEFSMEEKQFKVKGLGELRIMKEKEGGKSRVLMYDDCLRLKLNLALYAGIKYELTGKKKNNVSFIANKPAGPTKFMFRVKTGTAAMQLKSSLEANST